MKACMGRSIDMETLDVGGFSVEVHISGSGPPLLYLHAEQYFEQRWPGSSERRARASVTS
jgi:hypothetical protein